VGKPWDKRPENPSTLHGYGNLNAVRHK